MEVLDTDEKSERALDLAESIEQLGLDDNGPLDGDLCVVIGDAGGCGVDSRAPGQVLILLLEADHSILSKATISNPLHCRLDGGPAGDFGGCQVGRELFTEVRAESGAS
jgi:hypothetical protein